MGRIRTIKPEFCLSESMSKLSRDARLTFILLWTFVDDSGRARGSSRLLASVLYPYEPHVHEQIGGWLDELVAAGCLDFYEVDGSRYVQVHNWLKHQKIDHPSPSKIPPLADSRERLARVSEDFALDQGSGIRDLGPRTRDLTQPVEERQKRPSVDKPEDVSEAVWTEWRAFRKTRRASVSALVIQQLRSEAAKAGITLEAAMRECVVRGWQGFKAQWWLKDNPQTGRDFSQVNYREGVDDDGRF